MTTPFHYRDAVLTCLNERTSISYKDVHKLVSKNQINELDIAILEIISKYKYLNKHNINIALNNNPTYKELAKNFSLKKRLGRLTKFGLIQRYHFDTSHKATEEPKENGIQDSPSFYILSPGASAFVGRRRLIFFKNKGDIQIDKSNVVCSRLAVNQFVINYTHNVTKVELNRYVQVNKKKVYCYAEITISGREFVIEPVRRLPRLQENLTNRLTYLKELNKAVIFVCEDDKHITQVYNIVKEHEVNELFTTDRRCVDSELKHNLMICREHEGFPQLCKLKKDIFNQEGENQNSALSV